MKRRLLLAPILTVVLFAALAAMGGPPAWAHPLGNFTINRYAGLVLSPGRIDVRYVVDMAEIPTFQESPAIDTDGDGSLDATERRRWASRRASEVMANLTLTVDGERVDLGVVSQSARMRTGQAGLPVLSFAARFRGSLTRSSGNVRYSDGNFLGRIGWKEVTARSNDGVAISDSSVPATSLSRELQSYPKDLLSSPIEVSEATLVFHPGRGEGTTASSNAARVTQAAPGASGGAFAALVIRPLTPLVLVLSLLLAFGFGAIHALGPGHGKTITAAYLVGQGARPRQAAAMGAAVAIMHTASVLVLGLVVFVVARSFPAEQVYPWLTLGTGLVALALGAGLLMARIWARRKGTDPWHGHAHIHSMGDPDHDHEEIRPMTPRGLVALAMAGGMLPSPTAFVVLTGAVAAHRVGYGLALIFAFSLGLAASLLAVGLLALRARAAVSRHLSGGWMSVVPIGSALVIVSLGLFFATKGIAQLS
jgi:nickel/cobalt transporter (NicO) family protein